MNYTQIIIPRYDSQGRIRGKDQITGKVYSKKDMKIRPDIQQRLEKALNTGTYLVTYPRGTRHGFKFISKDEGNTLLESMGIIVTKKQPIKLKNNMTWKDATPPKNFYIDNLKWKFLVRNIEKGKNILMVGSSGCGKTDATFKAAESLGKEVMYFNLGATQDPRSTLIGNTHYNKDTGTYFSESLFVTAIQKENAVILLDELSRAHPEAWNILMTVLDPIQRYLRLDEKDDSPTIKVAKGVSFIATANIGTEYTSTRVLDRALLDRFTLFEMDILNEDQEYSLLEHKFPHADKNQLLSLSSIIGDIRKEVTSNNPKISNIISTRNTIEIAELLDDGFTIEEAAEVLIYPLFSDEGGNDSERIYIRQLVQKYLPSKTNKELYDIDGSKVEE